MGYAIVKGQWYNSFTLSVPKHAHISLIYTVIEYEKWYGFKDKHYLILGQI